MLEIAFGGLTFGSGVDLYIQLWNKHWKVAGAYVCEYQWIFLVRHDHSVRGHRHGIGSRMVLSEGRSDLV